MQSLNVLMVTAWVPTNDAGGVNTVIRTLKSGLNSEHKVSILVNDWNAPQIQKTDEAELTVYTLRLREPFSGDRPFASLFGWLRDLPCTLLALKRIVEEQQIDIVHLHYAASYQHYFRILRLFGGPPYLVTLHRGDTVNFDTQPALNRLIVRWMLRGAGRIVAVSEWLADLGRKTFKGCGEIDVVANGVNLGEIDRMAQGKVPLDLPFELPEKYCLSVANITHYKGIDVAIDAWSRLRLQHPDIHLIVVGEPREEWDRCLQLIETHGCSETVHLVGARSRAVVLRLMAQALALICPSRSEGLPMVLLEAGALGIPVVCSRIGPFMMTAEDGVSAVMVTPEDAEALAKAVDDLLRDPARAARLGAALQESVRTNFSAEHMVQGYLGIYRQLTFSQP